MKILLVSERDELRTHIKHNFIPRGAEIIQYYNPIKAMDNLEELDPEVVLFSARDFPRHWKPFLVFLRDTFTREQCVFVLLTGKDFDHQEADKAQALAVNGIVEEQLRDRRSMEQLKELVNRYRDIGDARGEKRLVPSEVDDVRFVFTHPTTMEMVFGHVEDVSATGIALVPFDRHKVMNLAVGSDLSACSLRVGGNTVSISARIVRNERALSLAFGELTEGQRALIRTYVASHPQRELDQGAADEPAVLEPV
jgi:hypothetical protein